MAERQVPTHERSAYLAGLAPRRDAAAQAGMHFWVFECAGEDGRFLEFAEGPDADPLAAVVASPSGLIWREVAIIDHAHTTHSD